MNSQILLLVTLLYGAGMFFVAWRADRSAGRAGAWQPLIYALALGIYCSSWTFFGAVGRASRNGWDYLPIYLGPILLFVLGWPLLRRLLVVGPRNKATSIADFIGSRFGKSQSLAGLVTLVAVVGTLPYIALQLEAVELAWATVNGRNDGRILSGGGSTGLVTAMLMAWFAILFGTRQAESQARNRGMMMAISIESVIKLVAFMLIAWLALDWLLTNPAAAGSGQVLVNLYLGEGVGVGFFTQTLLAATAIICLPRQFHLLVVERHSPRDLRFARWLFPLYLGLFSLLVIPVVVAGVTLFSDTAVTPDTYVLSLPLNRGWSVPAGAAFIGGISAATGMIVVSTMTVSIMITNELLVPVWLRLNRRVAAPGASIGRHLLNIRRGSIIAVLLLSWSLQHQLANIGGLASLGLIAFAAAAQLAPGLVAALYWRRAHRHGVLAGLLAGMSLWAYTLLLPAVLRPDSALLADGPWGFAWLAPNNLLGTGFLDPLTHAVMWSLGMNVLALWQVSRRSRFRAVDVRQARAFMQLHGEQHSRRRDLNLTSVRVAALNSLVEPLLGMDRAQALWREFETRLGHRLLPGDRAPRFVVQEVESTLAGIIGAASAHRAMGLARSTRRLQLTDLASLVDDASQQLQFSHELLETTIETISQGISVVDADLRLVAWNKRYEEIFSFPSRLLYVGCPIRRIYEYNAERGLFGANSDDIDHEMDRRMARLRSRQTYRYERRLPDNTVIEIEGAPLASGGFVTTYTDISDFKRVVAELEQSKQLLEQRVTERTSELVQANESLRRENSLRARVEKELADVHASKSRFLAAASHDLLPTDKRGEIVCRRHAGA